MFVRKVGNKGKSAGVVLPPEVMKSMQLETGNLVLLRMPNARSLIITKINEAQLLDREIEAIEPIKEIYA